VKIVAQDLDDAHKKPSVQKDWLDTGDFEKHLAIDLEIPRGQPEFVWFVRSPRVPTYNHPTKAREKLHSEGS
jgi:hypothetical protein